MKKKTPAGTKRRKTGAQLVAGEQRGPEFLGRLKGIVRIVGDIESPIESPDAWESAGMVARADVEARDLELINRASDELNAEVEDILRYQALPDA